MLKKQLRIKDSHFCWEGLKAAWMNSTENYCWDIFSQYTVFQVQKYLKFYVPSVNFL